MRRRFASHPEVARRRDQGCAAVVHPDAIDEGAGRQWVVAAGDGVGQFEPAAAVAERLSVGSSNGEETPRQGSPRLLGLPRRKTRGSTGAGEILQAHGPSRRAGALVSHFCTALRTPGAWLARGRSAKQSPGRHRGHRTSGRTVRAVEKPGDSASSAGTGSGRAPPVKRRRGVRRLARAARRCPAVARRPARPRPATGAAGARARGDDRVDRWRCQRRRSRVGRTG